MKPRKTILAAMGIELSTSESAHIKEVTEQLASTLGSLPALSKNAYALKMIRTGGG